MPCDTENPHQFRGLITIGDNEYYYLEQALPGFSKAHLIVKGVGDRRTASTGAETSGRRRQVGLAKGMGISIGLM